jgi:iron-sulfur cluster assembly protein
VQLRLAARRGDAGAIEYAMGFDAAARDDVQTIADDITVLISPDSAPLLAGAILDYVEIDPGERVFIFMNPNDPSHKPPGPGG